MNEEEVREIFDYLKGNIERDLFPVKILLGRLMDETGEDPQYEEIFNEIYEIHKGLEDLEHLL